MSGPGAAIFARYSRGRLGPFIAFVLGAATVAGFAPLYLFPLPVITLALLMLQWHGAESPRRAAWLGWYFGFGCFITGVSWVYVSLHTFGAMAAPIAAFFTVAFCAYLALFPAAAGYIAAKLPIRTSLKYAMLVPSAWVLLEWLRGWLFTGFPWLALGYSQVPASPLAGYAPVLGIGGVTLATAAAAGLVATLMSAVVRGASLVRQPGLYALAIIWLGGYGLLQIQWTHPAGTPFSAALLQGNIAQDMKWQPRALRSTLETYLELTLATESRLVVLPETALPLFLRDVPRDYLERLAAHAARHGGDVLIGVPEGSGDIGYYNSVISIGASKPQVYRKWHLVPFGEFIPLRPVLGWIVNTLSIPLQDFSRGSERPQPLDIAGQRVAVNICYEDAFGEEIIRQLPEATALVNVSNVAWFGRSIAPYQHLQISQARALETGRYMLRATNTGMTGVIDPRGMVVALAPQFTRATVTQDVQGYAGATPYVRWGNAAVLALCMLIGAIAFLSGRVRG
ncbi:MAG: apolipoprotein N-acyltransferase [Rhodospirillaceae bacterium]